MVFLDFLLTSKTLLANGAVVGVILKMLTEVHPQLLGAPVSLCTVYTLVRLIENHGASFLAGDEARHPGFEVVVRAQSACRPPVGVRHTEVLLKVLPAEGGVAAGLAEHGRVVELLEYVLLQFALVAGHEFAKRTPQRFVPGCVRMLHFQQEVQHRRDPEADLVVLDEVFGEVIQRHQPAGAERTDLP